MKFLIVSTILACATASPSGLVAPYAAPGFYGASLPYASAHLPYSAASQHYPGAIDPTIPPGDLQGAAVDAQVEATNHAVSATDVARHIHDKHAEFQQSAENYAEEKYHTAKAQVDGAAAASAPQVAKQLVRSSAPLAAAAPLAYSAHNAPLAYAAHATPFAYSAHETPLAYPAHAAHLAYSSHAAPLTYSHASPLAYSHASPLAYSDYPAHAAYASPYSSAYAW